MTPGEIVDVSLIGVAVVALVSGWRQGALSSVLGAVGVISGLVCGVAAAPLVMEYTESVSLRFFLVLACIVVLAAVGNVVGSLIGGALRRQMRFKTGQLADSIGGALFQIGVALLVVWIVAQPLAARAGGLVQEGIDDSRVLGTLDDAIPPQLNNLPAEIEALLERSGWPEISNEWLRAPAREVAAPAIDVANPEVVLEIQPSVVHVISRAEQCSRRLLGSGAVMAPDYVVTNAHVVAGATRVDLETVLGMRSASVVFYDPDHDLAVLYAPGLTLPALQWADEPARTGDDAVVLGYPRSAPYTATPARIRERITISGPDIYATGRVERETYTLRAEIQQGNSGGPLITMDGRVLGIIFGAAVDSVDTGYALTQDEVLAQIGEITQYTRPVDTGACVSDQNLTLTDGGTRS